MSLAVFSRSSTDSANYKLLETIRERIQLSADDGAYHTIINTYRWSRDRYLWVATKLQEDGYDVIRHPLRHGIIISWDGKQISKFEKFRSMFLRFSKFAG